MEVPHSEFSQERFMGLEEDFIAGEIFGQEFQNLASVSTSLGMDELQSYDFVLALGMNSDESTHGTGEGTEVDEKLSSKGKRELDDKMSIYSNKSDDGVQCLRPPEKGIKKQLPKRQKIRALALRLTAFCL